MYSAIKIAGKPLYQFARAGQTVQVPPRQVHIHQLKISNILRSPTLSLQMEIQCSQGTYVRSLIADFAEKLDSVAHMTALQRTATSGFNLEQDPCYTLSEIQDCSREQARQHLLSIAQISHLLQK